MAKKQAVRHVEPEEISQDIPDEEPARVIDEDESDDAPEANGSGQSKTDLIREAVQAGYEKPALGVGYIKKQHGVDIDPKYFSIVKGKLGKTGQKTASAPAAAAPLKAAAPSLSNGSVPASLFDDLKQLRQMKDRYGDDFEKMVEAIS